MNNSDNSKDGHWNNVPSIPPYINYEAMWQPGMCSAYNQPNDYMYQNVPNVNSQGPMIGLQALCAACTRLYPNQPNPLQVTARIKYWLGGPDPLDYISMYWNTGCKDLNIPPHWHYISFGLSDLHGDGRVHPRPPPELLSTDSISGLGLEISFRILGDPRQPPTWPAALLQRLAMYIFNTGNRLCVGDHISWHSALDGSDEVDLNKDGKKKSRRKCKIRHMVIAQDSQLGTVDTPLGKVQFVQIVGVTDRELKAAQRSGGTLILETIARDDRSGGPWFVTDMERRHSVAIPNNTHAASDLSGVAANCRWEYWEPNESENTTVQQNNNVLHRNSSEMSQNIKDQIKCILQKGLSEISLQPTQEVKAENVTNVLPIKAETDTNLNECKMSTDSVKFLSFNENIRRNSPSCSNVDKSIPKELSMLTDSFEMSKIGAALIEDIRHMANNNVINLDEVNKNDDKISPNDKSKEDVEQIKKEDVHQSDNTADCRRVSQNEIWSQDAIPIRGVHLVFDHESGSMLPLALRCRILHGRHFTWKAVGEVQAITLVATNVSGAIVTSEHPIAANNGWLQILISDEFAEEMASDLEVLVNDNDNDSDDDEPQKESPNPLYPLCFTWPHKGIKITITKNI